MAKNDAINILLTFFSTVRTDKDSGAVQEIRYGELLEDTLEETHTTNESGLRYVMQKLKAEDKKLDYYVGITSNSVVNATVPKHGEVSHLAYIKQRLQEILASSFYNYECSVEEFLKTVRYDENASKDATLISIQEAINTIKDLSGNRKANLYIDLSGGMRDANVIMLIVSRILEYEPDISVKTVLYSYMQDNKGYVQEISLAYNLLDLAAGINEFVNYGSAKTLDTFFRHFPEEKLDGKIRNLLTAMRNFAEIIQVCHYEEFMGAISELKKCLGKFDAEENTNAPDAYHDDNAAVLKIVTGLVGQIRYKYDPLFNVGQNIYDHDLTVIKWCYDNNYIQQAMTLITERIPLYFFLSSNPLFKFESSIEEKRRFYYNKEKDKPGAILKDPEKYKNWFYFWSISKDVVRKDEANYAEFEASVIAALKDIFPQVINRKTDFDALSHAFRKTIENKAKKYNCAESLNTDVIISNMKAFRAFWFKLGRDPLVSDLDDSTFIGKYILDKVDLEQNEKLYTVIQTAYKPVNNAGIMEAFCKAQADKFNSMLEDYSQKLMQLKQKAEAKKKGFSLDNNLKKLYADLSKKAEALGKNMQVESEALKKQGTLDIFAIVGAEINKPEGDGSNYEAVKYCIKEGIYSNGAKLSEKEIADKCSIARLYFDIKMERNAANHSRTGAAYSDITIMIERLIGGLENYRDNRQN